MNIVILDDHVGVFKPNRQLAQTLDCIGVHLGGKILKRGRAGKLANSVLVIIKNHNIHTRIVPWRLTPTVGLVACQVTKLL